LHIPVVGAGPPVVSAREALEAKLRGSAGDPAGSGLPELESALWTFLTNGKSREFLLRVFGCTQQLLDAERFYVRIGRRIGEGRNTERSSRF
jgi:hypothetical protein